jgi:hypothetical protein
MANECIPFYEPGTAVTGVPTTAVVGCRFVMISGDRSSTAGPTLGNIAIAPATAAGKGFGVAARDAAVGTPVKVHRSPNMIVPVQATNATITAFAEVEIVGTGANAGMVQTKSAGVAVGYVVTGCAANGIAQVSLY